MPSARHVRRPPSYCHPCGGAPRTWPFARSSWLSALHLASDRRDEQLQLVSIYLLADEAMGEWRLSWASQTWVWWARDHPWRMPSCLAAPGRGRSRPTGAMRWIKCVAQVLHRVGRAPQSGDGAWSPRTMSVSHARGVRSSLCPPPPCAVLRGGPGSAAAARAGPGYAHRAVRPWPQRPRRATVRRAQGRRAPGGAHTHRPKAHTKAHITAHIGRVLTSHCVSLRLGHARSARGWRVRGTG